jgi:hypothetical protein
MSGPPQDRAQLYQIALCVSSIKPVIETIMVLQHTAAASLTMPTKNVKKESVQQKPVQLKCRRMLFPDAMFML